MATVVCLHAHPDDEAIFTGGTIARLAAAGHRVVLVVATSGEEGRTRFPLPPGDDVGRRRAAETEAAAAALGVARVVLLGYRDSGMPGDPANAHPAAFGRCDVEDAAARVAAVCAEERADALTTYDTGGIYPHPDHLAVHVVGTRAAALAEVGTVYEATVDHEYLHFVDVHLVEDAGRSLAERTRVGLPTAEITTVVDCRAVLEHKWRAMAAHASQIPDADAGVPPEHFAAVYGYEWFVRRGPAGPLETSGLVL